MQAVAIIFVLALMVEALVETGKKAFDGGVQWPAIAAAVIGIGVCLAAGVGIMGAVGITFPAWLDAALTGVLVSRGSNFISDLFGKLNANK